jgi:hypothetical protein
LAGVSPRRAFAARWGIFCEYLISKPLSKKWLFSDPDSSNPWLFEAQSNKISGQSFAASRGLRHDVAIEFEVFLVRLQAL